MIVFPKFIRWPAACAVACFLCFFVGYAAGMKKERSEAALRAAAARVENIEKREALRDAVENLDDDAFGSELDRRLSGPQP